jgi:hypothetical protein
MKKGIAYSRNRLNLYTKKPECPTQKNRRSLKGGAKGRRGLAIEIRKWKWRAVHTFLVPGVPVLLLMYPQDSPKRLTSISLAVVFFNALSGSEAYARMRRIDYRSGLMLALATIPGAIIGALHTASVPRQTFNVIFGVLLLAAAAFLLFRPKLERARVEKHSAHMLERHLIEADGAQYDYEYNPVIGLVLSFFVGYISSFLGVSRQYMRYGV